MGQEIEEAGGERGTGGASEQCELGDSENRSADALSYFYPIWYHDPKPNGTVDNGRIPGVRTLIIPCDLSTSALSLAQSSL